MVKYKKGPYLFVAPSKRKNKKYDVYLLKTGDYITSFGDKRYQQWKDKIGYYSHLDHSDKKRRENYYSRHGKDAKLRSAKWFSHKYLW